MRKDLEIRRRSPILRLNHTDFWKRSRRVICSNNITRRRSRSILYIQIKIRLVLEYIKVVSIVASELGAGERSNITLLSVRRFGFLSLISTRVIYVISFTSDSSIQLSLLSTFSLQQPQKEKTASENSKLL